MKHAMIYKQIGMAALIMGAAITANAQNLSTGYYNDQFLYRHKMNPAYGNERNYIAVPALGNFNITAGLNVNATDIFYQRNNKTVTLLHPDVSPEEALGNLQGRTRIGITSNIEVLGAGFKAWGGYNTVDVALRTRISAQIPKTLFTFLKEDITNKQYGIYNTSADAISYAEIAFGHSRQLNDKLRVGAKAKLLLGMAFIQTNFNKAELTLGTDEWVGVTNATVRASMMKSTFKHEVNDKTNHEYVSGIDTDNAKFSINGIGAAIDLGLDYKIDKDWSISAAVTDLGFMSWNNSLLASTDGDQTVHTGKYKFNADDDADNSFDNESDKLVDDLSTLYELNDKGVQNSYTQSLGATVNVGVRYELPCYRKLNFGLMNTTYIYGDFATTDFRLSANVAPTKQFSASVSLGIGTFGTSMGWLLNYTTKGFSLYAGMDHTPFRVTENYIPAQSTDFTIGLNVPF